MTFNSRRSTFKPPSGAGPRGKGLVMENASDPNVNMDSSASTPMVQKKNHGKRSVKLEGMCHGSNGLRNALN